MILDTFVPVKDYKFSRPFARWGEQQLLSHGLEDNQRAHTLF